MLDKNDSIALIGDSGIVVNLFDKSEEVTTLIRNNWKNSEYEKIKYIYEDETGKEYALLTFKGNDRFSGIVLLREIFQIDIFYRYILLVVYLFLFSTLQFFLFLILKQDRVSVISDKGKKISD